MFFIFKGALILGCNFTNLQDIAFMIFLLYNMRRNYAKRKIIMIEKILFNNQDLEYKKFHTKLMPGIDSEKVVGVRIPILRKIAKDYWDALISENFLNKLPHNYYEENNLHAFLIAEIKDYDKCIKEIDLFLPFIDNWATCDSLRPKCFRKNKDKLILEINKWLNSSHTYTVRFAIEMLMVHFLDNDFKNDYLKRVSQVKSNEYYINMMIAWYFATALSKRWEEAFIYIKDKKLDTWVHNKTIGKAIESYRIPNEKKEILRNLKI